MNRNVKIPPHRSSMGLEANLLCMALFLVLLLFDRVLFIGAWALPLLAYLMEKQSEYVKKMALQASVLGFLGDVIPAFLQWVSGMLGGVLLGSAMWDSLSFGWTNGMNVEHLIRTLFSSGLLEMIPLAVLGILSAVVSVGTLVISIMGAVQSYRYQDFEIPLIFPLARQIDEKIWRGKRSF